MYTRWRWISPVSLISSSTFTYSGGLNVGSLVRHSSSEYFGVPGVGQTAGRRGGEGCRRDGQHEGRLLDGVGRRGDGRAHRRSRIPRFGPLSNRADGNRGAAVGHRPTSRPLVASIAPTGNLRLSS